MKRLVSIAAGLGLLCAGALLAEDKPAPEQRVFESKMGNVTFDHAKHVERAKNDCKACHPAPFSQDKAPLNYGAQMHKKAETERASCATCHVAGGTAFESKGNCNKCHIKKPA